MASRNEIITKIQFLMPPIWRSLQLLTVLAPVLYAQAPARREASRGLAHTAPVSSTNTDYFALVIGNNNYKFLPGLSTALGDAQEVARILRTQYGFQAELLLNATREQILNALSRYRRDLSPRAALLIYYAGHGHNDTQVDKTYWLPVDAKGDQNANWISADDITTDIKGIKARHILVVSDSCYSGALLRNNSSPEPPSGDRGRFLDNLDERGPSRILLASGGNEPVADGGGVGQHSVFASALLNGLQNIGYTQFTVEELFLRVRESVGGRSDQIPQLNPIRNSGHEDGSFIFARSGASVTSMPAREESVPPQVAPSPASSLGEPALGQATTVDVTWKGDMAIVEETVRDPKTGKASKWTVQFDWSQGRHVEIVAKTSNTTTTLSFLGNNGGLYMIEVVGPPLPEFWNKSNGVHYLDSVQQPNSATVPETTKQNIQPTLRAIFAAADAATKNTPTWSLDRRYPGLRGL